MFSLAAYRYRNILADSGGPVERLQVADMTVLGRRQFLANAFLDARLAPRSAPRDHGAPSTRPAPGGARAWVAHARR